MSYTKGHRYITVPAGGGTNQLPYREIQTPAYGSTVNIAALDSRSESIKVEFATITGAMTLTADVNTPYALDELTIVLPADSTGRTVTFSTGFTVTASTIVLTSSAVGVVKFVFSTATQTWVEASRAIN